MKDQSARGSDIAERLLELGAGIVRLVAELPRHAVPRHIGLQVVRSATSAGANYQEADELIAILVASARTARARWSA